MPQPDSFSIIAVVLIVVALVYYLVSTIVELRRITPGLDVVITHVSGIVEKSAPVNDVVTTINEQLDAGVDLLEGLLVKKAGLTDAVGLVDGLYAGAAAAGFRNVPGERRVMAPRIGEVYTKGTLTLARLGREAPIAAASPDGPVAAQRRGRQPRRAPALPRGPPDAARRASRGLPSSAPTLPSSTSSATTSGPLASGSPVVPERKEHQLQTPASFEYERATSVDGAIASLQRLGSDARIIAGGHSLLPMMKLRLANPEHLIDINDLARARLHPRAGRRDQDRRADPPRRPAEVRAAGRALPALPRRRERDRRPRRAEPRHDRRLAVPGGRSRGPLGGLHGRQGEGRDPRRRRRARRRDGRVPRRART